ncbi:HlyD family efflux transporter periplasmic adaptor subunit [Winogradskyella litoriviva]|uniref:HlyD family efflux transporter periplasmic adaptor subunit n=1 Tax=Winogradskyella litoriviva TaxID=1220182 RepID=A0ABX2EAN2_9FLAO|nr:HlyD family efflux transporter periplasmic adaptor subunit [Winogradskyella litoriviva]NRD24757.1 HlyD family efflux transporter periplasmic adaptor subunit [Winogradskyella litoriviva]
MLNISNNQLNKSVNLSEYKSGKRVFHERYYKHFNRFLLVFAIIGIIILFLPWTQNITSRGNVTTLTPDQRPQTIQSPIPGRIEQWFVREGDFVSKGDTIMQISEIKSEYFDPNLVERTASQRNAKAQSVSSYGEKVKALNRQISALSNERNLKLQQAKNKLIQSRYKVQSDSIDLEAAITNKQIAQLQFDRTVTLQAEGFKATKDVEDKRLKLQETEAKLISQENKLLASKNEVINAQVEISRVNAAYADKISKAQSDKYTAQSSQFDTEAQVSKLDNQYSNYQLRNDLRFIKAPFDGYVNKAIRGGVGQTFKEGEALVGMMPAKVDLAVETFVEPIDLPLINIGEKVRVQFDGWPAIVFSGWPDITYGTYGAKVVAIENFISDNGKFRVLLAPDEEIYKWPKEIRAGSGAYTMALLEDVPIWFELWRKLNGFPPNYYQPKNQTNSKKK